MQPQPLSPENSLCDYICGDFVARYRRREAWYAGQRSEVVELLLLPQSRLGDVAQKRPHAPLHPSLEGKLASGKGFPADIEATPLMQVSLRGEVAGRAFLAGNSMLFGGTTQSLVLVSQTAEESAAGLLVKTRLRSPAGLDCIHFFEWKRGTGGCFLWTEVTNRADTVQTLEHLSSFCLNGLSPFAADDAPERLFAHTFRSAWSAEGRHEVRSLESLQMERSWAGYSSNVHRIGAVGSLPVRGHYPFIGLEDREAGVIWGAHLAWHGPWQMEISRRDDPVMLSGGLADFAHGHWAKELAPGESFASPRALAAVCEGDIDELCTRLVALQTSMAAPEPESETDLPVIFNEWCTTWGNPTEASVVEAAQALRSTGVRYLVIDDGWAERPGAAFQQNGDWIVNRKSFPDGLRATARKVRETGLIPGIWFEFEVCNDGSRAFSLTDHHLKRHGQTIQVGTRHFWDFRDPFTRQYLTERVIDLLRDNEFGYLKVDYNESIGIGVDGAESLGEGLRQHLVGVEAFFREIRRALPELVFECCSSGGHRQVSNLIALTSMSSFSDSHEGVDIPIIAANLQRLMPARKNQIWCVVRPDDDLRRLRYGLAATFLGRMCLSGDIARMDPAHLECIQEAIAFYGKVVPLVRSGKSRLRRQMGESWRYPAGLQAVTITGEGEGAGTFLAVIHAFENAPAETTVGLPGGSWAVVDQFGDAAAKVSGNQLSVSGLTPFSGNAFLLSSST